MRELAGPDIFAASVARGRLVAALVFAGCFVSALVFTHLRFPKLGTAILFPSYAVLTAALLVEPPRRWWMYLLASAAGNFVPHLRTGPASFVMLAELANFTRALIVALAVRRFGNPLSCFDSLRNSAVFLGAAVVVAPAVAGGIGALVVMAHRDAEFWLVFRAWFFSNALTGLTLLPMLWFLAARPRLSLPSPPRLLEASALMAGLLAVGLAVFLQEPTGDSVLPGSLYLPLPFLLWAAVRFGSLGVGAALLCLSGLTILGAVEGRGPFVAHSPAENLLELQQFLIVVSIPLLLLSAVIEEKRRTSEELRAGRAEYQAIVEDQTEMICRFRPDGRYVFVNQAFCRLLGLPRETVLETSAFELVSPQVMGNVTNDHAVFVRETERPGADGEPTFQQWTDRALFDSDGSVFEFQSVGRDVTSQKRNELQARELMAQREVEAALRADDRKKDEFLAVLGHELRNPLAPIGTTLELLALAAPGNERVEAARQVIGRQLAQLKRLVDDLLDVSRITRGLIRTKLETIDARTVLEQALETVRPSLDAHRHELRVVRPDRPVWIHGDRVRLTQVLVNLLTNAIKYTEAGGHIALSLEADADRAVLSVEDNGMGIPPHMLERVFQPFERLIAEPGRGHEGLGIGLTLARRLVELHGGDIAASSDGLGHGTRVVVHLPVVAAPELSEERGSVPSSLPQPLDVLVVDDNVDAANSLADLLCTWGHEVRFVHDGAAALRAVHERKPDVVLSDLGLPDISGLELASRLREKFALSGQMLVAITGFGQSGDRVRSLEAGFDEHLVKPIDLAHLTKLLEAASLRDRPFG